MGKENLSEDELVTILEISPNLFRRVEVLLGNNVKLYLEETEEELTGLSLTNVEYQGEPKETWFNGAYGIPEQAKGHSFISATIKLEDSAGDHILNVHNPPFPSPGLGALLLRLCDIAIPELDYYGGT